MRASSACRRTAGGGLEILEDRAADAAGLCCRPRRCLHAVSDCARMPRHDQLQVHVHAALSLAPARAQAARCWVQCSIAPSMLKIFCVVRAASWPGPVAAGCTPLMAAVGFCASRYTLLLRRVCASATSTSPWRGAARRRRAAQVSQSDLGKALSLEPLAFLLETNAIFN